MIVDCDKKIKEVENKGKNTEEGRKKFREYMVGKWIHVLPHGQVDLGYEELQKLNDIFNIDIDAINAPHQNAHWNWEPVTAKASYDFMVGIFGYDGKLSMPEWFSMILSYDRDVKPFVEPVVLTDDQIKQWAALS